MPITEMLLVGSYFLTYALIECSGLIRHVYFFHNISAAKTGPVATALNKSMKNLHAVLFQRFTVHQF